MASHSKKEKRARERLHAEVALLVALVLHGLMLVGFRASSPETGQLSVASDPGCVLLSDKGERSRWEDELVAWADLLDPTLLSLPNETRGFSAIRCEMREARVQSIPAHTLDAEMAIEGGFDALRLSRDCPSLSVASGDTWLPALSPPPPAPLPSVLPTHALWRFPDGTVIDTLPRYTPAQVQAIVGTTVLTSATRLEITNDGKSVRVVIRRSCGLPELDLVPYHDILDVLKPFMTYAEKLGDRTGAPWFLPTAGDSLVLEVEWRLVPPRTES